MGRSTSTTLVLVSDNAPRMLGSLDEFANVRATSLADQSDDAADRWVARSSAPFVVHDRDPLAHVAAAWVEFFDDLSTIGTLDLEIDRAVGALSRDGSRLPDYYIIVDPEALSPTWKHWWLGVLPAAAPTRVIPWNEGGASLAGILRHLPTGRAWPDPEPWLRTVARAVPDRVGLEHPPAA